MGQADTLALVDATYRLSYTPGLISGIYGTKISPADLASQGGFADLDGDGSLWAPSLRPFYSPDPASPDPAYAQQHFYLACGATDPWGNVARVGYDGHNLLVTQTTDAADNITLASVNYRVLQPWLRTDPNANRSGVRYDALGMVVATASMGKLLPDGDRRRRPPRHQHRRTGRWRRPDRPPRIRPVGVPDVGGRPRPRSRPSAASLGAHQVPGTAQGPGNALAGDLCLQ